MKRALLAVLIAAAGGVALGQEHANDARGFQANKVYDVHDVDTINMFNGNLTIRIPIGPVFRANALISYQFALSYNSHVWKYEWVDYPAEPHYQASPREAYNAGLGWMLSFGQITGPSSPPTTGGATFIYKSPDGAEHPFGKQIHDETNPYLTWTETGYTKDQTNLRLRYISDTVRELDFPDGTTHVYWLLQPAISNPWPHMGGAGTVWRLREIKSALENRVTFTYARTSEYHEIWTIQETKDGVAGNGEASSASRTSKAYFRYVNDIPSLGHQVLDRIELPTPPGASASTYELDDVVMNVKNPSYPTETVRVALLTRAGVPTVCGSAASYAMLNDAGAPAYNEYGGTINRITLPTLGRIGWTYIPVTFPGTQSLMPRNPAIAQPLAVYERSTYAPGSTTAQGVWRYGRRFGAGADCYDLCLSDAVSCGNSRQLTSWVRRPTIGPAPSATLNYYSIYDPLVDRCGTPAGEWSQLEYGLPFTRYATRAGTDGDPTLTRYLSTQVVNVDPETFGGPANYNGKIVTGTNSLQATYVQYATPIVGTPTLLTSSATVHEQDTGCSGQACYSGVNQFHPDGFGHFRQTSTVSNIPGDDQYRTTWKNYATTLDAAGSWVLATWDKECSRRDSTASVEINLTTNPPCAGWPLVARTQFARPTGLLTARRTLSMNDTLSGNDVLATTSFDAKGQPQTETFAGADKQALTGGEFTQSDPTYRIDYTNNYAANGGLLSRTAAYAGIATAILNETFDAATGLVTSTADAAGVTTKYTYDDRYRLKSVAVYANSSASTAATAPTTYTYTDGALNGTTFTPARVTVARQSTTAGLLQQQYDYDGFGRLIKEHRLLPSGTSTRETKYTATGLKERVSEFASTPSQFTVFSGFDVFDRPARITAPDNTFTEFRYRGVREVDRDEYLATSTGEPTKQTTVETYDALQRLRTVAQPKDTTSADKIVAQYEYDVAGHLIVSRMGVNAATQQPRTFAYDARGFLTSENQPETGPITYGGYDARGHVGTKTYATGSLFDQAFEYDAAARLRKVFARFSSGGGPWCTFTNGNMFCLLKEFVYATANASTQTGENRKNGKLETATRYNYHDPSPTPVIVKDTYAYVDAAGRVSQRTTVYENLGPTPPNGWPNTYIDYTHNDADLLSDVRYPITTWFGAPNWLQAQPQYANGLLIGVKPAELIVTPQPDFTTGAITYWPTGMVNTVPHNNGITDTYAQDPAGMPRPGGITFANINDCALPTITSITQSQTITAGSSITLTVTATGNPTYAWYEGTTLISTNQSVTRTPTQTTQYKVHLTNSCGTTQSQPITITVAGVAAPTALKADHISTSTIRVTWQASAGATSYQVWRRGANVESMIATPASSPYDDAPPPNAAYVYWVKAVGANGTSGPSNVDLESTLTFSMISTGTEILFAHLDQLRVGLNAVRWVSGNPALSWTDLLAAGRCAQAPVPQVGERIYAAHLATLRCEMTEALQALGLSAPAYTNNPLAGLVIRAIDFTELQNATDYAGDNR